MKVLRIINTMNPQYGGPCQGIRNSIPELEKLGVTNEVLSFDDSSIFGLIKDDFKIHAIGPAKGPFAYCAVLGDWLKNNIYNYDVVIIHGLWLHNSFGTYNEFRKLKKKGEILPKLYIMPHGMLDPYFQKAKDRKLKSIRNFFFWHLFESKVINNVDGVLFTCEEELLLARTTFSNYKPKKELNIGYGIKAPLERSKELDFLFNNTFKQLKDKKFILFLSRIHIKKGVDLLIKAYLKIKKDYDGNIPDLLIVGPGLETEFGKELLKVAAGDSQIHFVGMLTGNLKWGAFYNSEAFILPSHQENFGISIVEAMSCNIPIMTTNKVNIYREIEKEKAGLISEDTFEGVYTMLKNWFDMDRDEKKDLGFNARNTYEKYFAIENVVKNMLNVFNKE